MKRMKRQQKSSVTTQSLHDHPICLVIIIVAVVMVIYYYFTSRWKLAGKVGIGRIEFFLLVEVLPRILLIICNLVNHCDLSTVKDMWVIVRTLGFIASWLTKVFSKLSEGNLLFGRDQIFSQTLKHCGVFKLLLAN